MFYKYTPRLYILHKFRCTKNIFMDKLVYIKCYFNIKYKVLFNYIIILKYNIIVKLLYLMCKKLKFILYKFYNSSVITYKLLTVYKCVLLNNSLIVCNIIINAGDFLFIKQPFSFKLYNLFFIKNFVYKNILCNTNFIFIIKI